VRGGYFAYPQLGCSNSQQANSLEVMANRPEDVMRYIEKLVLRIAVTGTPESIRECVRNCALDLPNDISRVEFSPLEIARLEFVEQLGEQDRATIAPLRPRRKRSCATGVKTQTGVRNRHQSHAPRRSA
jgi:hypothetical protein